MLHHDIKPQLSTKFHLYGIVLWRTASIITYFVSQSENYLLFTGMALQDIYDKYRSNYTIVFLIAPKWNVTSIRLKLFGFMEIWMKAEVQNRQFCQIECYLTY